MLAVTFEQRLFLSERPDGASEFTRQRDEGIPCNEETPLAEEVDYDPVVEAALTRILDS